MSLYIKVIKFCSGQSLTKLFLSEHNPLQQISTPETSILKYTHITGCLYITVSYHTVLDTHHDVCSGRKPQTIKDNPDNGHSSPFGRQ